MPKSSEYHSSPLKNAYTDPILAGFKYLSAINLDYEYSLRRRTSKYYFFGSKLVGTFLIAGYLLTYHLVPRAI